MDGLISDRDIAALLCKLYVGEAAAFDFIVAPEDAHGVCWSRKSIDGVEVILLRGSQTPRDWMIDLFAVPFPHSDLGPVHAGFYLGMPELWKDIKTRSQAKRIVAGHSLGAARAAILCGLMAIEEQPPIRRVVFGEPRPGFEQLANLVAKIDGASYCNGDDFGHDLITDVPFKMPNWPYTRPTPLIPVTAAPDPHDHDVFRYHHCPLYLEALS